MTDFEKVLQECLGDLERGAASVDECLSRHPRFARQLEPILHATEYLERARAVQVSAAFKTRVRAKLLQQMRVHPRKPARSGLMFIHRTAPLVRLAVGLAAVLLALVATGTAYAQRTLPGQPFYGWKLASESAWRVVSPDPVGADLVIAERRVDELIAVKDDPAVRAQALEAYLKTVTRLRAEVGTQDQAGILPKLDSQAEKLKKLGILLSQSDPGTPLPEASAATATPLPPAGSTISPVTPTPSATPLSTVVTPEMDLTVFPTFLPTMEIPPELVPTVQVPPPIR